jgi:hypothetical protein
MSSGLKIKNNRAPSSLSFFQLFNTKKLMLWGTQETFGIICTNIWQLTVRKARYSDLCQMGKTLPINSMARCCSEWPVLVHSASPVTDSRIYYNSCHQKSCMHKPECHMKIRTASAQVTEWAEASTLQWLLVISISLLDWESLKFHTSLMQLLI